MFKGLMYRQQGLIRFILYRSDLASDLAWLQVQESWA